MAVDRDVAESSVARLFKSRLSASAGKNILTIRSKKITAKYLKKVAQRIEGSERAREQMKKAGKATKTE